MSTKNLPTNNMAQSRLPHTITDLPAQNKRYNHCTTYQHTIR